MLAEVLGNGAMNSDIILVEIMKLKIKHGTLTKSDML
jgi:hypothetical protein